MSEWISVKDKLPSEKEGVLIGFFFGDDFPRDILLAHPDCSYQVGFIRDLGEYSIQRYVANIVAGGIDNNYVSLNPSVEPTHWMPLPEPPKETKK